MNMFGGFTSIFIILLEVLAISCENAKPTGMKQGIYCECCSATVKEISKKLQKKTSDPLAVKVIEAMESVCQASSFRDHAYSPPTTVKACKYLMENYDEDIEEVFARKESDPEKKICYELTKACEGVDRSKKEKEDMNVNVNGQQPPNDGINRLNVDINDPSSAARLAEQIKQQMAMQQQGGGSEEDEGDEEDEPEEGETNDGGENLLKAYDESGNEVTEKDFPAEDESKKDESKNEKTEL